MESFDESELEEEVDNAKFEKEMEQFEEAWEAILDILAFPKIKAKDFANECEFAMVYVFRYPLALVPKELITCFESL